MLWAGALALLRRIDGFGPVRALHAWLGGLPAGVALPLFLVSETVSHLAGAYATSSGGVTDLAWMRRPAAPPRSASRPF